MGNLIVTLADMILLLTLILCAFWGFKSGFLKMGFGVVSFVVAILLGRVLYTPIAEFLKNTPIYTGILSAVQRQTVTPQEGSGSLLTDLFQKSGEAVSEFLANSLAELVLHVVAFLLVVVAVKLLMFLIAKLLRLFASLPGIGLINRIAGLVFGVIEGMIIVTILLAGVSVISPLRENPVIHQEIEKSIVVREWYLSNPLVTWLTPQEHME